MKYLFIILILSSCSYLGIDSWFESDETPQRTVVEDQPKPSGNENMGINIYDQHHRYTFFMKIDKTVIFENAHREQNPIAGAKEERKLGQACKMQRVVGAYTRDILIVDNQPRMFRLMRSVSMKGKEATPILIAVDVKSGDTTFEIHCPSVKLYDTIVLENNFGFPIVPEKNKLKDNYI